MTIKLGIIGGGVMGEALLSRSIEREIYQRSEILVSDPVAQRRSFLVDKYGVGTTNDNREVAAAQVLFLAIKPQIFEAVASELVDNESVAEGHLVISIMAGVPISKLEWAFPGQAVIRAMANTPATVGAGISALSPGNHVQSSHIEQARRIFEAVGEVVEVPETMLDAVTGLSGSGPGYVAIAIEALTDGGVAAGLPRAIAYQLALSTVLGTAQLLKESGMHPAELKDRVTSPGGTTIAGVAKLESAGFRSALIEAVKAAYRRAKELGN